ncbi:hypothetical protein HNV11_05530 [Spirosoma taeanense]|uniref:N-acetyltransferase n=1 Tax=Spirosoma taeanense TaxID=2735870 RepID=A0A6M5Y6P7_9BACT|nr:hypothetical protein [Spirosoma taeanense]QJW88881.1 hypothetical protein HNV11_05530 [Spirosoma taeanense]
MLSFTPEQIVSSQARIAENVKVGKYTIIEDDVDIEEDVEIGNFCMICSGTRIGKGTVIKNYVEIRKNTQIGSGCYIDSQVAFSGSSVIGNKVTLRYGTIIARGVRIGDGTYVAPRVMTNNLDQNLDQVGGANIGSNCFISTNVVLQHGITVADNVVVGTLAFVNKDCEEGNVYVGVPARKLHS